MDTNEKAAIHDAALGLAEALQRHGDLELIEAALIQAWLRGKGAGQARAADLANHVARRAS